MTTTKYGLWKGKPLETYTKKELCQIIIQLNQYWQNRHDLQIEAKAFLNASTQDVATDA